MLVRIHNMEKDGAKADFTYDHEGRILLLKKTVPPKLSSQAYFILFYFCIPIEYRI